MRAVDIINHQKHRFLLWLGQRQELLLDLLLLLVLVLALLQVLALGLFLWQVLLMGLWQGLKLGVLLGVLQVLGAFLWQVLGLGQKLGQGLKLGQVLGQGLKRGRREISKGHIRWLAKVLPEDWHAELKALRHKWHNQKRPKLWIRLMTTIYLVDMLKALVQINVENLW